MSHGGEKKSHGKGIMRTSRLLFVKVTNKKKIILNRINTNKQLNT